MTDWIIRRMLPDGAGGENPDARNHAGIMASVACIALNIALCLAKAAIGLAAGSVSIVADAMNNLSDASSNIVSLLGFRLASKPPDASHPWGHGRFEYLSGLVVSAMVVVVGIELARSSIMRIISPSPVEMNAVVAAVLVLSIAVKLWMARFNKTLANRLSSGTLAATAADSKNDAITTSAVLISGIISATTGLELDGWCGLAVGAFIIWGGLELLRSTVSPLLGQAPDPALVRHIHEKIMGYPHVLGTHDLMVHDYGPGRRFASAHVEMPAELDPLQSHDIIDSIEQDFLANDGLSMVLHLDPVITNDPRHADLRNRISDLVKTIDPNVSIHDLRLSETPDGRLLTLDCERPEGLALTDEELREKVTELVHQVLPDASCRVRVDDSYLDAPDEG